MPVVAKPWYQSKSLVVAVLQVLILGVGLALEQAGVLQLTPQEVAIGGIVSGLLLAVLRLVTNTAIEGTPAANDAVPATPTPDQLPRAAADFAKQIEQMRLQRDSLTALLASVAAQAGSPPQA